MYRVSEERSHGLRVHPKMKCASIAPGQQVKTVWWSEVNSNCRYRFLNFQTTTSCYNFATLRRVALIVRNNAGSALLSQRSREAFSGMRHAATDSATGFQREAAPFWLRRFQRQKLKCARNAVPGNNASQPVSIAKPSMMPSYDSLETGTGSSNSLRSTKQPTPPLLSCFSTLGPPTSASLLPNCSFLREAICARRRQSRLQVPGLTEVCLRACGSNRTGLRCRLNSGLYIFGLIGLFAGFHLFVAFARPFCRPSQLECA
jgi:hypothetical protein